MLCKWKNKFKIRAFVTFHHLAHSTEPSRPKRASTKPCRAQQEPHHAPKTSFLKHDVVRTALQSCPCDLIALRYFLWCARQPHYFHDKPTFHHMANVVSSLTQRYGTVKAIVQELEDAGCCVKAQTFLLLMRIYWCGGMNDMVIEAFEEMIGCGYVPNTYVRNIVMDVYFKIGSVDVALRVLEEIEEPNFLSFNTAVCNLCRLNDYRGVKGVLRRMMMKGYYLNPDTYSLVLNCFCKFARLAEAWQMLGLMIVLGEPISVNVWSILIDGFCKSGQMDAGAYLLELMVKMGCSPNIVTCTSVIKGFLESRMPEKAFEILSTLESKGCFPDLVLCNVLINCLSKIGWYDDAFEVFCSLRQQKLVPDVYTYSSLVSAICLSREYILLPFLTSGVAIEPDLVVCNTLLSYFCNSGVPGCAVEFYRDMIDKGFQPDKYTFAVVLSALCKSGQLQEAVDVYLGLIRSHQALDAHIHTIIVNGLIKSGRFHKAIRLFRKAAAEKTLLDVTSFNVAINGLVRVGLTGEAYALFDQMKQTEIIPNRQSYNLVLSGFCARREFNMVFRILQEMVDRNIKLDNKSFKLMKYCLRGSPYVFDIFTELRNSGLLPEEGHEFLIEDHDASIARAHDHRDAPDPGTSSSDDLPEVLVAVG